MSKYNYPNWHEIKDLVAIYNENEWDNAHVKVWDSENQRAYNLVFCGSSRPFDNKPGEINFTVTKVNPDEISDEEKFIEDYFNNEMNFLTSDNKHKDLYKLIFKRGVELGKNIKNGK